MILNWPATRTNRNQWDWNFVTVSIEPRRISNFGKIMFRNYWSAMLISQLLYEHIVCREFTNAHHWYINRTTTALQKSINHRTLAEYTTAPKRMRRWASLVPRPSTIAHAAWHARHADQNYIHSVFSNACPWSPQSHAHSMAMGADPRTMIQNIVDLDLRWSRLLGDQLEIICDVVHNRAAGEIFLKDRV